LGNRDQALQKIRQGIRAANTSAEERWLPLLYKNAAILREQKGDLAGAKKDYRRSFNLDSSDPYVHYSLAMVTEKLGQKRAARQYCDSCLEVASKMGDSDLIKIVMKLIKQIDS
jgi:tetratricopeptide (TPR) repeat protein